MTVCFFRHDRLMEDLVARALESLQSAGVQLEPGLSETELSRIEDRFGFTFGPEHRDLLRLGLPSGDLSWPDWRNGSPEDLQERLDWPIDGLVFDVHNNGFWPASWGERPPDDMEKERHARARLAGVPRLAPFFSHRYLTAGPEYRPSPVFSVYQADVIYYGEDLLDYLSQEFKLPPVHPSPRRVHVPFWSDLAEGAGSQDL